MMGWIIGFAILWFVLRRSRRRMWRHRARMWQVHRGGARLAPGDAWGWHGGGWGWRGGALAGPSMHAHYRGRPQSHVNSRLAHVDGSMRRPASAAPRESEFDVLKRRYVAGDLSDEQYEAELDVLFSTAEGRRQV